MNRREFMTSSSAAAVPGRAPADAVRGIKPLRITEVRVYIVSIGGRSPVLVQILTD